MDAERRQKVARAAADLLRAIRELKGTEQDPEARRTLLAKSAPQRFLRAIDAFADAIGS
jgi:hypothetical protein